jgi:hypothetical protein
MDGAARWRRFGLALAGVQLTLSSASAGDHPWSRHGCPRSSYHRLNYLAPNVFRAWAWHQRHGMYLYGTNAHPEVPLHYATPRYRCPTVTPIDYPFPPFLLNPRSAAAAPAKSPPPDENADQ